MKFGILIWGYKILDKWLKSRKARELSSNEIMFFIQIVEILRETIRLMKEIDRISLF